MYQHSISRVKSKHTLTEPLSIHQGVHQGNVLSPLLFNIFINDISSEILSDSSPILYDLRVSHLLYADDLVLLSLTEERLQRNINKVKDVFNKWGLVINTDKSKIMTFSKTGRLAKNKFKFNIDNDELEYVKQYKYLGLIFSSNGSFLLLKKNT